MSDLSRETKVELRYGMYEGKRCLSPNVKTFISHFYRFINRTLSVWSVDHGTPLERSIMGFKIGLPSFSIFIDSFKSLDLCFNVPKYPQHALG